jgi:hypothetical protein
VTAGALGRAAPGARPATTGGVRQTLDTTVQLDAQVSTGAEPLGRLLDMFPPASGSIGPAIRYEVRRTTGTASLSRDGDVLVRSEDPGGLVVPLFADITAAAMASFAGFAAHAAVVTGPGGSVALLGESGAGKSTLTAACLATGLGFCSDEALCLRFGTAAVVPFPRPVSLLGDSPMVPTAARAQRRGGYYHAAELGGVVDHHPPPVAHVVILDERVAGAPVLTPTGPADGVQALLRMGFNHFRAPARAVDVAAQVVTGAAVWRLRPGDPMRTATVVAELVGTAERRSETD